MRFTSKQAGNAVPRELTGQQFLKSKEKWEGGGKLLCFSSADMPPSSTSHSD